MFLFSSFCLTASVLKCLKIVNLEIVVCIWKIFIEYGIVEEGYQIYTNQKRENSAFSLLIGERDPSQEWQEYGYDNKLYRFNVTFNEIKRCLIRSMYLSKLSRQQPVY